MRISKVKFVLVVAVLVLLSVRGTLFAQETAEPTELIGSQSQVKVDYTPSPDARVTGHYLYLENTITGELKKLDMKMETPFLVPEGNIIYDTEYKVYATAYGLISGAERESLPSNTVQLTLISPLLPPVVIRLYCN